MRALRPSPVFRNVRRGCCGCLLSLLIFILVLACLLAFALGKRFTPAAHSAPPPPSQAVLLAPRISPAPTHAAPFGDFYTQRIEVEIGDGPVWLASSPEGNGPLATDDQALLQIFHPDGTHASWTHDFRSADHSNIVPAPAQEVSGLFQRGRNGVLITLQDLTPFTYWSAPYYLIFTAPEPTPTHTATTRPTVWFTATAIPSPTVALNAGNAITPTPETTPTTPARDTPTDHSTTSTPSIGMLPVAFILLGVLSMSLVALVLFKPARKPRMGGPALSGWIDLYDRVTRESRQGIDLSQNTGELALLLEPLRLEPFVDQANAIAILRPTEAGTALHLVNTEPSEMDLERAPHILQDGERATIAARLELEYRNPRAAFNRPSEEADPLARWAIQDS